jgi:hypothetical protein
MGSIGGGVGGRAYAGTIACLFSADHLNAIEADYSRMTTVFRPFALASYGHSSAVGVLSDGFATPAQARPKPRI